MYVDLHSDTIFCLDVFKQDQNLSSNSLCIDAGQIRRNGVWQCLALYLSLRFRPEMTPWEKLNHLHELFLSQVKAADLKVMHKVSDLEKGCGVILTTENGASIEGDLSRLEVLSQWGVKAFGFTWNHETGLGFPNSSDAEAMDKGLKARGIEAISECERLGIAVDVSHLSDGGFWDVVKYCHKPFMATHSNCRSICGHQRNLTDDMLRALADKGGVAGLNFCPPFVSSTGKGEISVLADHIQYMIKVAGSDLPAIGTDFDGFDEKAEIMHPDQMQLLFDELSRRGVCESQLDKIRYQNAIRVFRDCEV